MEITRKSQAGTLESSDIYVVLLPNDKHDIEIQLTSTVYKQFGKQIAALARKTLEELQITSCILILEDRGALDFTIRARIESAVKRSLC